MNTIDLTVHGIQRPEKIRWIFPNQDQEILPFIKSKSLRNFLKNSENILIANSIQSEFLELSEGQFNEWLVYYEKMMTQNNYEVLANKESYQQHISNGGKAIGAFFTKDAVMVGSGIIYLDSKKAVLAYKASDRITVSKDPNGSLGAIIDYLCIKKMKEQHIPIISAGRSRNAFGVINTLGYLDYKLRFGYLPTPAENSPFLRFVPVNEQGIVLFYGIKDEKMALYAIRPKDFTQKFEQSRFSTPELPFIELPL